MRPFVNHQAWLDILSNFMSLVSRQKGQRNSGLSIDGPFLF